LFRRELEAQPDLPLPWERPGEVEAGESLGNDPWPYFQRGFFPELAILPERDSTLWYAGYVQTYLGRDVRTIKCCGIKK